jgi:hypothetical protein
MEIDMQKLAVTLSLILFVAQNSFAQSGPSVDQRLASSIEERIQDSYKYGKQFAVIADRANVAFLACLGLEGFVAGAVTGGATVVAEVGFGAAATVSAGAVGPIWITAAGSVGAAILPGTAPLANTASHSFKDIPMQTQGWVAPIVNKINASHNGQPLTLKLVNQNMEMIRNERMKILTTTLNGSFKSEMKNSLTCGYLGRRETARLAEIAATEYKYLNAVGRSLTYGYPVKIDNIEYSPGETYKNVFEELAR